MTDCPQHGSLWCTCPKSHDWEAAQETLRQIAKVRPAYDEGIRAAERHKIVAWLRKLSGEQWIPCCELVIADAIERGEHDK